MTSHTVRVWDLPTRLFHWLLLLCVAGLFLTAYLPGNWIMWHSRLGYTVLALVLFRLVWGFVGGRWSRFASFVRSPATAWAYLRGRSHPDHLVGHNPLGAGSVLAMLLLLLAQVGSGLVSDDEVAFTGPLNRFVSSAQALTATWYHMRVGQWLLVALIALHVAAIAYYFWAKKNNLVRPMISGDKALAQPVLGSRDDTTSRVTALVVLALSATAVWAVVRLGG